MKQNQIVVKYIPLYFTRRPAWKTRPAGGFHVGSPSEVIWKIFNYKCGFVFIPRLFPEIYQSRHITLLNYIPKHNFRIVLPRCQVISNCDVIYVAMNYATDNRLRIPFYAILSRELLAINSIIKSLQKRPIKKHINAAYLSRLASSRQICFECHECTLTELLICKSGSGCDIQYVNLGPWYPQHLIPRAKSTDFHSQVWENITYYVQ